MKLHAFAAAVATVSLAPVLAHGQATTTPQVINFSSFGDGTSTNLDGSFFSIFAQEALLFDKFDPALGTLTEVRLSVQIRTRVEVSIESGDVLDSEQLFSLFFDDSDSLFQTSLSYAPGGGVDRTEYWGR